MKPDHGMQPRNRKLGFPQAAATSGARPFKSQLLKWIGNKQRFAHEIISYFPKRFGVYHEPFIGADGVLGVLAPHRAQASDSFEPLIGIWTTLKDDPETLKRWYRERWEEAQRGDKVKQYPTSSPKCNTGHFPRPGGENGRKAGFPAPWRR